LKISKIKAALGIYGVVARKFGLISLARETKDEEVLDTKTRFTVMGAVPSLRVPKEIVEEGAKRRFTTMNYNCEPVNE